ncbi:MAG TPA: hypothetical protein VGR97_07450 [Candidatus Acidoferrales bacterium]|nr:hypothetical protein [Candidatus Acidoferrales bacterium]
MILLLSMGLLSVVWAAFSAYLVPHFIESAYYGHSLALFNQMIKGQAEHPVAVYLARWHHVGLRLLDYFWLLGLFVVLVLRPEFRRAVWEREGEPDLPASAAGESGTQRWREGAIVFVLYVALAFVFTLPNSIHPTHSLLGRGGDNYLHAWFLWEFARAVAHGQNPFHTNLILYPIGANLTWATTDILGQIMALPFSLLLGPVFTYNLSLVLQLALGAFFAWLLCQRVSGDAAAATIGGIVFGFSPFLLAHAWGHLSLVTAFPLPIYVLALGRLLDKEKPSWKEGVLLGLALVLVALGNYEYALIFVLFTLVILAIDLGRAGLPMLKRLSRPVLVSAAVFFLCLAPVLLMMLKDYGITKPAPLQNATSYSADLLSFFVPNLQQSLLGSYVRKLPARFFVGPGGIEGIEFIGFAALILAVIGCWVARGNQRRWAGRALVAAIVFALMSLGPTIRILGTPSSLPAPAALLYKLSVMRFLREPARLSIVTTLCMALLASIGLAFILSKLKNQWKRSGLVCVIGAIVLLEYLAYPFPSSSIVQPARYFVIPKTTQRCTVPPSVRDGAVLTIPLDDWWHFNDAMWMQIRDGGRYSLIDGRVSPYIPGQAWDNFIDNTPILAILHREAQAHLDNSSESQPPPATSLAYVPGDEQLAAGVVKQLNLRAVVVFDASDRPADVNYVRRVFGGNQNMVGTCAVFELPQK